MITLLHFIKSSVAAFVAARRQFHFKLTCGIAALAVSAGSAAAQTMPVKSVPIRQGSQPFAITMGEDGNFWFTLSNGGKVARITPRGSISYFTTPSLSNPAFITPGPDGNVWFGEGSTGKIASITPDGLITEHRFSAFGVSVGITTGSDGNMWFTEQAVDKFARITPQGVITEFTGLEAPSTIAAGPDGNLWITSAFTPEIARVPPSLNITIFPTPATPTMIRPGNSNNLLFTEFSANKIASITTDGVVTQSQEFVGSAPEGITAGVASRVWFLGVGPNRVYQTVVPR